MLFSVSDSYFVMSALKNSQVRYQVPTNISLKLGSKRRKFPLPNEKEIQKKCRASPISLLKLCLPHCTEEKNVKQRRSQQSPVRLQFFGNYSPLLQAIHAISTRNFPSSVEMDVKYVLQRSLVL